MSRRRNLIEASDAGSLIRRVPERGSATIGKETVCVVHEFQTAVLMRGGRVVDLLGPGRHVLGAAPSPGPSRSPAPATRRTQAAVYFVNQRVLGGMKWEARKPVGFSDRDLGPARLEAKGIYAIRVTDPATLASTLGRMKGKDASIEVRLEKRIVERLHRLLEDRVTSILDLAGFSNELATEVRLEIKEDFARLGIDLIDFFITTLRPTKTFERVLRREAPRMGLTIHDAPGSGLVLPRALMPITEGAVCPRCRAVTSRLCPDCSSPLAEDARFCSRCGRNQGEPDGALSI